MKKTIITESIVFLLVLLWVYAGFSKLLVYDQFRFQLLGHDLLMDHAGLIAWLVPFVEIAIALLLCINRTRLTGYYASAVMLIVFTGYIIYMFNFYPNKPCSCGGIISRLSWKQHIVFNLFFLIISLIAIRLEKKTDRPDNRRLLTAAMA